MFLFCIGAAKCGTTWLYDYLRGHPECFLRGHKELHYFDTIERLRMKRAIERLSNQIAINEAKLPQLKPAERAKATSDLLDIRDFQRVLQTCHLDKNAYFRYMMTGLRDERLVADITPDYANVSRDMLGKMVGVANETRFVYLMRDPVARFWSHVRMDAKNGLPKGADYLAHAREMLARAVEGEEKAITAHSNYARVLSNMEAVIPEERRLVMFYEDLMTPAGLRTLCGFLGIRPIKADFERQVHAGRSAEMADDERAAVRRMLRPQYEAVASRFPVLPKAWQATMAEGFA
jgi:hypothetical protein